MLTICYSCHRDCPAPMPTDCVPHEVITSKDTGFYVWTSGKEKDGYATAIKLNQGWRASAEGYYFNENEYSIYLVAYNLLDGFLIKKDVILINSSPFVKSNCIKLQSKIDSLGGRMIYSAVDDDVTEDRYELDESTDNNYLQIDTLNVETGRMAGKFMATFRRLTNNRPWNLPTVRFFNGEFHCNIVN
ncbi:MAG: hypothetical protein U0V49_13700 [Saprospiraceae bacterium]